MRASARILALNLSVPEFVDSSSSLPSSARRACICRLGASHR